LVRAAKVEVACRLPSLKLSRSGATKWGRGDATEPHILAHVPRIRTDPWDCILPRDTARAYRDIIYIHMMGPAKS